MNDIAELLSADDIWGSTVWQADEWLHKRHQYPLLRIAAVGRSGETGCLYAAVINEIGALPSRNMQEVQFEGAARDSASGRADY